MELQQKIVPVESGVISRFTLALLGCVSIGIGIGNQLPYHIGELAIIAGTVAILFYHYQTRRLIRKLEAVNENCRLAAESRLSQHVTLPLTLSQEAQPV